MAAAVEDTEWMTLCVRIVVDRERDSVWVEDSGASFLWTNNTAEWPALSAVLPVNS